MEVLDVFQSTEFGYYISDQRKESKSETFTLNEMRDRTMMIDTRPRYPSNKLSFTIANITDDTAIRFFNIYLNLNELFDVNLVLEDSQTFTKRMLYYNSIRFKGDKIQFKKDEKDRVKEYYITFR